MARKGFGSERHVGSQYCDKVGKRAAASTKSHPERLHSSGVRRSIERFVSNPF